MKKTSIYLLSVLMLSGCSIISRSIFRNAPDVKDQHIFPSLYVKSSPGEPFCFKSADWTDSLGKNIRVVKDRYSINTTSLDKFLEKSPTLSFMVIRNDSILYERYFDNYNETSEVTSFSVAKTFVGMLIGIAIKEGYIGSADDYITKYFPELDSTKFGKITVQHLLNQTSGIKFPSIATMYYSKNLKEIIPKMKVRTAPGVEFRYENGNAQLLGWLLERTTRRTLPELLSTKIWSKINTENDLYWSLDSKEGQCVKAFCCLNGTTRDFAKFGRLLLNRGNWNGSQVIPKEWMDNTINNRSTKNGAHIRYRNQMWFSNVAGGCYFACGLYGQYLYICPAKNIIIVKFSRKNLTRHPYWEEMFGTMLEQL